MILINEGKFQLIKLIHKDRIGVSYYLIKERDISASSPGNKIFDKELDRGELSVIATWGPDKKSQLRMDLHSLSQKLFQARENIFIVNNLLITGYFSNFSIFR